MTIDEQLVLATKSGLNVLLVGTHGVGKSQRILKIWDDLGICYAYFNAPTMDPTLDLVGIPTEKDGKIHYIKAEHLDWENVEFIFVDEPNRAHRKVINTLYELIQFKRINNTPLPKLRGVWVAMNPSDEGDYAVEEMDNSFQDRFHLHLRIPASLHFPSLHPFLVTDEDEDKDAFAEVRFSLLKNWYEAIPADIRDKYASPRRIEYALKAYRFGIPLASAFFTDSIDLETLEEILLEGLSKPTGKESEEFQKILDEVYNSPDIQTTLLREPSAYFNNMPGLCFSKTMEIYKQISRENWKSNFLHEKYNNSLNMETRNRAHNLIEFFISRVPTDEQLRELLMFLAEQNPQTVLPAIFGNIRFRPGVADIAKAALKTKAPGLYNALRIF